MKNRALSSALRLSQRNYVRKAKPNNKYWVDFSYNKMNDYVAKYGKKFYLIIWGAENIPDDFYMIPYVALHGLLTDEWLSQGRRKRWIVSIPNHQFRVHGCSDTIPVQQYYGVIAT